MDKTLQGKSCRRRQLELERRWQAIISLNLNDALG